MKISEFSEILVSKGYKKITCIDYSKAFFEHLFQEFHERLPSVHYMYMDARMLSFPEASFDVVFDKGLLDSALTGELSYVNAKQIIKSCLRVLKPFGKYIIISHSDMETRKEHFLDPSFDCELRCESIVVTDNDCHEGEERLPDLTFYAYIFSKHLH
eukprot:MONOS_14267.1-p1 / transcript=MONOS_14267.1 / gene=MONOS_14267 / organism=Monocercomonoides_exilis_PA203 / gene_product=Endothelin-converting enzyme 2 F (Ece2F) / transcript_product=Endothelin-converting enzyme 2 F (Ece2F) / location=Mono_scaffold00967:15630-16260(-) / protein_length=157 / sequence_SO=supercontig / SO=protein_coding / is_pseudo=false